MGKLRVGIVDSDGEYIQALADYINSFYHGQFKLVTFGRMELLNEFLLRKCKPIDMLLISPELYTNNIPVDRMCAVALWKSGSFRSEAKKGYVINKYQPIEKIISNINQIFSDYCARKGQENQNYRCAQTW